MEKPKLSMNERLARARQAKAGNEPRALPPMPEAVNGVTPAHMHVEVFKVLLFKAGVDNDTIEDCIFRPREEWDGILDNYEKNYRKAV